MIFFYIGLEIIVLRGCVKTGSTGNVSSVASFLCEAFVEIHREFSGYKDYYVDVLQRCAEGGKSLDIMLYQPLGESLVNEISRGLISLRLTQSRKEDVSEVVIHELRPLHYRQSEFPVGHVDVIEKVDADLTYVGQSRAVCGEGAEC